MYDEGWYYLLTARGGSENQKPQEDVITILLNQLKSWGCKFNDLSTGSKGKYISPPVIWLLTTNLKEEEI